MTATDENGNEYIIAKNYRFRATAKELSYIDAVVSTSAAQDGLGEITIHSNGISEKSNIPLICDPFEGYTIGNIELNQIGVGADLVKWYSLQPEIADDDGVIKTHPASDMNIRFAGVPVKLNIFTDILDVSQENFEAVIKCGCSRLVNMNLNEFRPKDYTTHAEAAAIVQRINALINNMKGR